MPSCLMSALQCDSDSAWSQSGLCEDLSYVPRSSSAERVSGHEMLFPVTEVFFSYSYPGTPPSPIAPSKKPRCAPRPSQCQTSQSKSQQKQFLHDGSVNLCISTSKFAFSSSSKMSYHANCVFQTFLFCVNDICLVRFPGGHRFPLGITKYLQEWGDHEEKSLNSCVNPYIDKDYLAQKMGLMSTSSRTVSPYVSVDVEGPSFRSGWSKLSDQQRFLYKSRRDYEKTVHGIKRTRGGLRQYSWKESTKGAAGK